MSFIGFKRMTHTWLNAMLSILLLTVMSNGFSAELTLKQRLLMPGQLTQSHAKLESDCEQCHNSFDKKGLTQNCLACHDVIAADRREAKGFHGLNPAAANNVCDSCHLDHEGRDRKIDGFSLSLFDHQYTNFTLDNAHQLLDCKSCHEDKKLYREADSQCIGCHKQDDIHDTVLGDECSQCHRTTNWQDRKPFDHSKTDFMLRGAHSDALCSACHVGQVFVINETECSDCHLSSDVHLGANGLNCASCHNEQDWAKVLFDHNKETDFTLLGEHEQLPCRACHASTQKDRRKTPTTCIGCHQNDDAHQGRFGTDCQSCHDNSLWTKPLFNHRTDTNFMLTGRHEKLSCTLCHTDSLKVKLPETCIGCHQADDVHRSKEMTECDACHSTTNWKEKTTFDHEFTQFPLVGMHAIVPCSSCHLDHKFTAIKQTCVSCHEQEDTHQGALGDQCQSCHNPNGWDFWQFDHDRQTDFRLQGAHQGLSCAGCHAPGSNVKKTATLCASCHQADDIHKGGFGQKCGDCHVEETFSIINILGNRP